MTSTTKTIIAIVVVIIIAAGFYYWYSSSQGTSVQAPSQNAAMGNDSTTLPSGSDNSDAALTQDLNSINGQMQTANADSATVDASVNSAAAQ